jgi:hypothetical protein
MSPVGDRGGAQPLCIQGFSEFEEPLRPPSVRFPDISPSRGEKGASGQALRVLDRGKRKYRL